MDNDLNIELKEFKNNPDLNRYNSELLEDTKLTKMNIREKSLMVSSLRCKWLNYYFREKENLQRIRKAKDVIIKQKMSSSQSSGSILKMKSEDMIAGNDEKVKKLNDMAEVVKTNIDFLERALNILNDFGFCVKNCIDVFKLEKM